MSRDLHHTDIDFYNFVKVQIAEFDLQLEIVWLIKALSFVENEMWQGLWVSSTDGSYDVPRHHWRRDNTLAATSGTMARRAYMRLLHITPLRIYFSYLGAESAGGLDATRRAALERRLGRLSRLPASSAANVECAGVKLNMLRMKNVFASRSDVVNRITAHYKAQLMEQIYTFVFSADILGQPLSLVTNLGTGVHDFFHEPAKGFFASPEAFVTGVRKGTSSLVKHSVGGVANTLQKTTGGVGTGLSLMTFDDRYQQERHRDRAHERAKDVGDGLLLGARDFAAGLFHGITGLVVEPVRGAMDDGVSGLGKGVVRGVLGVAVKPVVGVFDAVSRTSEGVRNATLQRPDSIRMRPPRIIDADEVVRPYDIHIDEGRYFAFRLGIGEYQWHCDVSERRCVVCTTTHVALLGIHRSAGEFADVWRVPLHRLSGDRLLVERTGRRPSSSSSSTTTSTGGGTILLISSEERMYRIPVEDDAVLAFVFEQISLAIAADNQRRVQLRRAANRV
eukprot:CAMPEP_0168600864 /NCGR_PEP_ID=MMETSP0420-20121227/13067_1 /TAXON_ID=498008 /ORGANISM="Pessonella sp." /LENGTH=505 /DNA_ID=CAMNT_0008639095 /DNA_START=64 /DNA_END=1581 /DNA_ORIENTATION=-